MARALTRRGLQVATGQDGVDVVKMCITDGRRFDVLLIDAHMDSMDGTTAVAALRQHERQNGLEPTLVIATSGSSEVQDLLQYHNSGMNGVLVKPINIRGLVPTLGNCIDFLSRFGAGHQAPNAAPWDLSSHEYPDYVTADPSGQPALQGCVRIGELLILGASVKAG